MPNSSSTPKLLFPGQQVNEQICLSIRAHWLTLVPKTAVWIIFAILPVVLDIYILPAMPILSQSPAIQVVDLLKSLYLMALITALFAIWILYYLNYQIVTNERIVDMTQKNLLYHTVSEVNLSRIQDVTAEIRGVFGTLFNYGNVFVQTAGEMERFKFDDVPDPHRVAKLILDLYEKLPQEQKQLAEKQV